MFDFRILRLEFENIIAIFEISILEFLLSLCLVKKKKSLNLEKIAYTWLFLERNLEIILSYFKSALSKLFNWIIF